MSHVQDLDQVVGLEDEAHAPMGWWYEAIAFCSWLTDKLPKHTPTWLPPGEWVVNLSSEAQWERVARGSKRRTYPWGEAAPTNERANFEQQVGRTTPVGTYPLGQTPDGDLAGNVWEWCLDNWDQNLYQKRGPLTRDPIERNQSVLHVVRGGAWFNPAYSLAAAFREWYWPGCRVYNQGFRCCLSRTSPSTPRQ